MQGLVQSFLKPYDLRTSNEVSSQAQFLDTLTYFKTHINNSSLRMEYIENVLKHTRYSYYPKGTCIYQLGEYEDFGIILSGQVFLYKQKKENELKNDASNLQKQRNLDSYIRFLQEKNYPKLLLKCGKSYSKVSLSQNLVDVSIQNSFSQRNENREKKCEMLQKLIEEVLKNGNEIVQKGSQEKDLSIEDKLLLLNHKEGNKTYVKDGLTLYKKVREINNGETIGECALSINVPTETIAIASEDVHFLTLSRKKLNLLYKTELGCFEEKEQFFSSLFPNLDNESIFHLCIYVEEKLCNNQEFLYNHGDEPNAMFFVKTGRVQVIFTNNEGLIFQLYTNEKENKNECSQSLDILNRKQDRSHPRQKRFVFNSNLKITTIDTKGFFGGLEIFNLMKRTQTAISSSPQTFLYVLKKEIYTEIIAKYLNEISLALKCLPKNNTIHPQSLSKRDPNAEEPKFSIICPFKQVMLKTTRLMTEVEAQYRNIKNGKLGLITEAKLTSVLYQEGRNSRLTRNQVEITVCDTVNQGTSQNSKLKKPCSSLQDLDNDKKISIKSQKSIEDKNNKIHSIKSSLFIKNQMDLLKPKTKLDSSKILNGNKVNLSHIRPVSSRHSLSLMRAKSCTPNTFELDLKKNQTSSHKNHRQLVQFGPNRSNRSQQQELVLGTQSDRLTKLDARFPLAASPIPSIGQISGTPELEDQRPLTAGSIKILKRVRSSMPKKRTSRNDNVSNIPILSLQSIAQAKADDLTRRSKYSLPKTTTSFKTLSSLGSGDRGSAKSTVLGSWVKPKEESTQNCDISPFHVTSSSFLIPSFGNIDICPMKIPAVGSLDYIETETQEGSLSSRGIILSSRRKEPEKNFDFCEGFNRRTNVTGGRSKLKLHRVSTMR